MTVLGILTMIVLFSLAKSYPNLNASQISVSLCQIDEHDIDLFHSLSLIMGGYSYLRIRYYVYILEGKVVPIDES